MKARSEMAMMLFRFSWFWLIYSWRIFSFVVATICDVRVIIVFIDSKSL